MSQSEDEDYAYYGVPLEPIDEGKKDVVIWSYTHIQFLLKLKYLIFYYYLNIDS